MRESDTVWMPGASPTRIACTALDPPERALHDSPTLPLAARRTPIIIDMFTHIFPAKCFGALVKHAPYLADTVEGIKRNKGLHDLDTRFRMMDGYGDYRQVVMLPNPPLEEMTTPETGAIIAKVANDAMAELVAAHPDRFAGFAAALPIHDMDAAMRELDRAIRELGAVGAQIYTNIDGRALDEPAFAPFFDAMARYDLPIWIHPARAAGFPDYQTERRSRYLIWFCFGWPYETSAAMTRLVFSGLFDRHPGIKIITHHMGAMIPFLESRISDGYAGWKYGWERSSPLTCYDDPWALAERTEHELAGQIMSSLKRPLIEYFKMFYADTALNGGHIGVRCGFDFFGLRNVVFSTDAPFTTIPGTMDAVRSLGLPADQLDMVCRGNAERLLNRRFA